MSGDFTESESELAFLRGQLAEARENLRLIQQRKSQYVIGTDVPPQLVKEERQLLERIGELEQRVERLEETSEQAARLGPLYEQLQAAAARQEWAEVLALGGRIQVLDPAYRDVAEWMGRARDHLQCLSRRLPRVRPAWLWPVVGGAAVLLVVIGVIVVAFRGGLEPSPRLTETRPLHTATSRPTDTRVALTVTSRPAETLLPPTATLRATETPTPGHYTGARPPAEANIGDTWTRPADGMVMVYVPAGEFLTGSGDADSQAFNNEKLQHTVYLDGYWIDRTEVTNAQYRKCVEAGACQEPGCWGVETLDAPDQPVVCVSWDDALAYAAWAGGRLPTEAEWEKAARGTDGRIYPWGNSAPNCGKANYSDCTRRPTVVGSCPIGASPYGALDMAGNVWEWVADRYGAEYYARSPARNPQGPDAGDQRVLRGGAFNNGDRLVRCAVRLWDYPGGRNWGRGFRLVAARAPRLTGRV